MTLSRTLKIGITGGIGTGKSTVSSYIGDKGYKVIDADQVAREVVQLGSPGLKSIERHFGKAFLTAEGQLNRKKLGEYVFQSEERLKKLNAILHPIIKEEIQKKIAECQGFVPLVFLDIPLLFEGKWDEELDAVLLVYADDQTAFNRIKARDGLSDDLVRKKIKSQMSIEEKKKLSTVIIDNTADKAELYKQVDVYLKTINIEIDEDISYNK